MDASLTKSGKDAPFILRNVVALLFYLGAAGIGLEMALWQQFAPLIWPPAGVGLVLLLIRGPSLLPVIVVGGFLVRLLEGGGLPDALIFGLGYGLTAYLSFLALKRLEFRNSLERIRDINHFLAFGVLLFPLLSSGLSTLAIALFTPEFCPDFISLMSVRWLSDALGVLVLAPFLLVWYSKTRINWRNEQALEVLAWILILIILGALVFRNWAPTDTLRYPMELAMFPIMAWAAIRFGQRGVTPGILIASMMAVWELRDVIGPDATKTISQPPGYLWMFVGILASTSLYLAATWTELRKREDTVRVNEGRLRTFVRALPDLALVFNRDAVCTEVLAPLSSKLRERMSSFRGKPVEAIYPAGLARKFRDTIVEVLQKRNLEIVRYAISIDGEDRSFEGRFAPIEAFADEPSSVMVISYDLTESQRAHRNLQRRDMMLKCLTDAEEILLKEKVFHRGVRRALESVGKSMSLDLIQIYEGHLEGDSLEHFTCIHEWTSGGSSGGLSININAEDLKRILPAWHQTLERGEPWEMHYSRADDKVRTFLDQLGLRSLHLYGVIPQGGAWGFIAFGSSLEWNGETEHESAVLLAVSDGLRAYMETQVIQDQLEAAREAAVAADQAKSEFLAIMSHEIRTPMNAIIGFSDLLKNTELSEQQDDYVDIITRSGRDLMELINNILDFSKLESSNVDLEHTQFIFESVLSDVTDMVLFRAKEKGIEFIQDSIPELNHIYWGDPLRIRQVMLNLLTNAIKFTHEGSVRLEVEILEVDEPWYTFEMRVIDSGIGIPEEHRVDLFKPFRQVDSSTTREYGGTGLGLTIVQRLVDKMGGRVSLQSTVGKGSTFSVVLKLERHAQDRDAKLPTKQANTLYRSFAEEHPMKILVVEDDRVNTRLICEILGRLGYVVDAVSDGYKALSVLAEARHNLVLMDMQMAKLDGLETTARIRSGECSKHVCDIPIVAMTALALAEEKKKILDSGVDYFLSKPLQLGNLKEILEDVSSRFPRI